MLAGVNLPMLMKAASLREGAPAAARAGRSRCSPTPSATSDSPPSWSATRPLDTRPPDAHLLRVASQGRSLASARSMARAPVITFLRIDSRLIHGQVVEAWLPGLKVSRVVVADDEAAHSPLMKTAMGLAVPPELEVDIRRSAEVPFAAHRHRLRADPAPAPGRPGAPRGEGVRAFRCTRVNLGNVHHGPMRRQVSTSVFLNAEELAPAADPGRRGVDIEARGVPVRAAGPLHGDGGALREGLNTAPMHVAWLHVATGGGLGRAGRPRAAGVPPGDVQPSPGRRHRHGPAARASSRPASTWAWSSSCSTWAPPRSARRSPRTTPSRRAGPPPRRSMMASQTGGRRNARPSGACPSSSSPGLGLLGRVVDRNGSRYTRRT